MEVIVPGWMFVILILLAIPTVLFFGTVIIVSIVELIGKLISKKIDSYESAPDKIEKDDD